LVREEIAPGSSLAADDAVRPDLPISHLAWFGVESGVEHLAQLADVLTAEGLGLRPFAPFTLTRSALLAASQAVWLLSPSQREQRLRRSALIYADEFNNHRTYLNDYKNDERIREDLDPTIVEQIDAKIADLDGKISRLRQETTDRYYSTTMLREAAEWVTRHEPNTWQLRAFLHEWRMGSAAAHSRLWSMNFRPGHEDTRTEQGITRLVHSTDQELGTTIGAAYLMTKAAFGLWDMRRVNYISM
jgi:hypothetical protein